jgi:pSer/pThr/pTyr-binding forkhead associated (FHA) protein
VRPTTRFRAITPDRHPSGHARYTDLRSTNGSFPNGSAVSEIALGPGDVLQIGSSTVTVEPAP